jgi:hypothetical protein
MDIGERNEIDGRAILRLKAYELEDQEAGSHRYRASGGAA